MPIAVIRSFSADEGLILLHVEGENADVVASLCGSDRSTVAKLRPGQPIEFEFSRDRQGCVFAIDITAVSSSSVPSCGDPQASCRNPPSEADGQTGRAGKRRRPAGNNPTARTPDHQSALSREANLEDLLASPTIRRLMERDGVDPLSVRRLVARVSRDPKVSR